MIINNYRFINAFTKQKCYKAELILKQHIFEIVLIENISRWVSAELF